MEQATPDSWLQGIPQADNDLLPADLDTSPEALRSLLRHYAAATAYIEATSFDETRLDRAVKTTLALAAAVEALGEEDRTAQLGRITDSLEGIHRELKTSGRVYGGR